MANKKVTLEIGGDSTGAERAAQNTIDSLDRVRRDANKGIGKVEAFEQATADLQGMQTALDETRRKLAYFKEQAKLGGDIGAKQFAADIRGAEKEIDRLNAGITKQGTSLRKLDGELGKAGIDTRNLANEKQRLATAAGRAETGIIKLRGQMQAESTAAASAAANTRAAGNAAEKAGTQGDTGARGMGNMASAMKAVAAGAVVKQFIDANASMESMTKSLEAVTGSSEAATREMEFVRAEAQRLGLEVGSAANSYVQLAASAKGTRLEGQATREIWSAVAESMARLGKTSAETDGALLAISQMMSKGVVSAEELRGQLGERLPGAFSAAARAMGTTTQGLGDMLEAGTVIADEFLPKFAVELGKVGGGEIDTFNSNLARMKNTINDVFLSVGDTGAFDALNQVLKGTAVGVVTVWEGLEFMGRTLANVAYTISTLDFSGYQARQKEALDAARADVEKVIERIYPLQTEIKQAGTAGAEAGQAIQAGMQGAEKSVGKAGEAAKKAKEDFKSLGIDPEEFKSGLTTAERDLANAFARMVKNAEVSGDMLLVGFANALQQIDTEGVQEFEFAIQDAFQAGRVSAEQLDAAMQLVDDRRKTLTAGADDLEAAYKKLGIQSQAALKGTADEMRAAYDTLVKMAAPLADQNAAWQRYAEAAIAANGGVASSTIQSQAAMRGYVVTVDDAGKATVRLKEVTEQFSAASAEAAANLQHAQRQAALATQANQRVFGSIQSGINDFHEHVKQLGEGMAYVINTNRAALKEFGLTDDAASKAILNVGYYGQSIGGYLDDLAERMRLIKLRFAEESEYIQKSVDQLNQSPTPGFIEQMERELRNLTTESKSTGLHVRVLGENEIAPLRDALADARAKMEALETASTNTLRSAQDDWDQYYGNLEDQQQRRNDDVLAELQAQLESARAAKNTAAIESLEQAIKLQEKLAAAKLADAKADEAASKASDAATVAASSAAAASARQREETLGYLRRIQSEMGNLAIGASLAERNLATLSDENLATLRASIEDAERKMLDLRDASADTLESIQDEWDRYYGNLAVMQERQNADKRAELESELALARAAKDSVATANLEKAIKLQEKLAAAKLAEAKADEQAEKAAKTSAMTTTTQLATVTSQPTAGGVSTSRYVVDINLAGTGISGSVETATQQDADTLRDLLIRLQTDMTRT